MIQILFYSGFTMPPEHSLLRDEEDNSCKKKKNYKTSRVIPEFLSYTSSHLFSWIGLKIIFNTYFRAYFTKYCRSWKKLQKASLDSLKQVKKHIAFFYRIQYIMITFTINYPFKFPYRKKRIYLMWYEVKFYPAQCQAFESVFFTKITKANEPSYKEDYLWCEPSTNNQQLQLWKLQFFHRISPWLLLSCNSALRSREAASYRTESMTR